jgi:hypothetical protein
LKAIEARKRRRSIARKVARKAAYLQKLAAEGKYDPAKPTKPDPERYQMHIAVMDKLLLLLL